MLERFPRTRIDHDTKAHYQGWLDRRLLLNRCCDCRRWHHPPRSICPSCWSTRVEADEATGRGVVHLVTRLHQGPPADGVTYDPPHPVVAVELEEQEGLRYTSTVVDCDQAEVCIGLLVELTWIEREGAPFPVFRPTPDSGRSQNA